MSTLYEDAASVLEDVLSKKASLKALCFHRNSEQKHLKNPKMIFAVVARTLPYYEGLARAIKKTSLFRTNKNQSKKSKVCYFSFLIIHITSLNISYKMLL